ncbi:DUF4397 domain-containing protein [Fulvivirga sp.]|uniref:DUF4397 domain-containing protein n=1 Tax=Fulvivirga sp. TaxID=1931237 RepID=UPI0032F0665D
MFLHYKSQQNATPLFTIVSFFIGLFILTSCLDDESPSPEYAYLSLYHASPDTDAVDILIGDSQVNSQPFSFKDYSERYISVLPGSKSLEFINEDNETSILDTTFSFEKNKYYSVFIADSLNSIETIVFGDSVNLESLDEGEAMIRFIHMSPDSPDVEVLANDDELFASISFKNGTPFEPFNVESDFSLTFKATTGEESILLTDPNVELQAGRLYTIILTGFLNAPEGNSNEISYDIIKN